MLRLTVFACTSVMVVAVYLSVPRAAEAPEQERDAPRSYTESIPGSDVRFDMVGIPGGTFIMGSSAHEQDRTAGEGPQHPVRMRAFWMGKTEVTWDEFDVYREKHVPSDRENDAARARDADAVTRPTPPHHDVTWGFGRARYPA